MSTPVRPRSFNHPFHVIPSFLKAATFSQVLETDEGSDEKAITAMGLLNTIETLLNVMEDQPEIMSRLQPTVLQVVGHIFSQSVMGKYTVVVAFVHVRSFAVSTSFLWSHRAAVQTGTLCLCTEQGGSNRRVDKIVY